MSKCVDCEFYEYNKEHPDESCPMNMGDTSEPEKDLPCEEFILKNKRDDLFGPFI